jgi:hypothetical protein
MYLTFEIHLMEAEGTRQKREREILKLKNTPDSVLDWTEHIYVSKNHLLHYKTHKIHIYAICELLLSVSLFLPRTYIYTWKESTRQCVFFVFQHYQGKIRRNLSYNIIGKRPLLRRFLFPSNRPTTKTKKTKNPVQILNHNVWNFNFWRTFINMKN